MIKNNIRKYRLELGYSQSDLATLVGCSKNAISMFERGEFHPSLTTIFRLLDVFCCHFNSLFYREDTWCGATKDEWTALYESASGGDE